MTELSHASSWDAGKRPFEGLDPDTVLRAVESLGLRTDGRVMALNSFENRVFRVGVEDAAPVVAKFYRPQRWSNAAILEEHEFSAELQAAELPVVAPLRFADRTLHDAFGFRFAMFPLQGGQAPELERRDTLTHLGRMLARIHNVGESRLFLHRPRLDIARLGEESADFLLDGEWLPVELSLAFERISDDVLEAAYEVFDAVPDYRELRLHGDCHPGNLLWRHDQAHFVDLDDAINGPAIQDLWMLLAGDANDMRSQWEWLVQGYREFRDFDVRELALIEALRSLRLLHYNAWLARRWEDPAFPAAFPWFNETHHWQNLILQLREQLALLQAPPVLLSKG
ncbi:MAG TPA: serine/threonine protein kinase [Aquimonas sp.]|nr:serine/threonine protein kinase [Aquimonas sp.]HRF53888.1 serine/threonine protein kinase [Aquimonas sp.]